MSLLPAAKVAAAFAAVAFAACLSDGPSLADQPIGTTDQSLSSESSRPSVEEGEPSASQPQPAESPRTGPTAPSNRGEAPPAVTAKAVLVFDERSNAPLYELNAHARLPPASLTKIATAVVVLESGLDLDRVVSVNPDLEKEWLEDSATMGLQPGDHFSLRELLYGMLLVSGNDAARELAIATAGSEEAFVQRMNELAHRLGLKDTHFADVHGLGSAEHYTSAWDLALLSEHAMTLPEFRAVVGSETHVASGTRELSLYNLNPLLNYTPGVDGVKTGYTEEAGPTFVASAERDGHRITVVLLDAPSMALDAIALIEWAFRNFEWPP